MPQIKSIALCIAAICAGHTLWAQQAQQPVVSPEKLAAIKADLMGQIDGMKKQAQVMNDTVFSFGELGFQEFETSKYLSDVLEKEGFSAERGGRESRRRSSRDGDMGSR